MRFSSAVVGLTLLVSAVSGCAVMMKGGPPEAVDTTPAKAPAELAALTVRVGNIHPRLMKDGAVAPTNQDDDGYVPRVRAALRNALTGVGYKVVAEGEPADVIVHVDYLRATNYEPYGKVTYTGFMGSITVAHDESVIDQVQENMNGHNADEDAFARALVNAVSRSKKVAAFARAPRRGESAAAVAVAKTSTPAPQPAAATTPTPATASSPSSSSSSSYLVASPQPAAYALIIGIEKYRDVASPTGARTDAEKFAKLARQTLGVPESHIKVALDDRATKGDIEKHLDWLKANAQPGSRIYFFFSGHGAPEPSTGTSYVLPYDGDPRYLEGTALRLQTVLTRLQETKAREVLAVMDSCFSGAGGRSVLPPGARALVRVQAAPTSARIALFSASSGTETSGPAPGAAEGLFTQKIVEGLGRGEADMNGDGQVSLEELGDWVRPRVAREAKRDHRDQTPTLSLGKNVGRASDFMVAWGLGTK